MPPLEVDLRWVAALLYRNEVIEESGVAGAVLNHPANGVAWLANKLAAHGVSLDAGSIVLAGSFTRPVRAGPEVGCDQARSNRSAFITLFHAATKSVTNFSLASSLA